MARVTIRNEGQRLLAALPATLTTIAKKAGVTAKQTVSDWKLGDKVPNPNSRRQLKAAYGIPVEAWDQVVTPAGEPAPAPATSTVPPAPADGEPSTIGDVDRLLAYVRVQRANPKVTPEAALKYVKTENQLLAQRARLEERAEALEDRLVHQHPSWRKLKAVIVAALKPHPKAAKAVLEAIVAHEAREAK